MSAQLNHTGYVASRESFNADSRTASEVQNARKVSDVEQELAVLNKQAEAVDLCVDQLEKRLACVLTPTAPVAAQTTDQPRPVRVPLAEMIETANNRLHAALIRFNGIIARIELPS